MSSKLVWCWLALLLSVLVLPSSAVERGRQMEGRQAPGGSWSERSHQGGSGHRNYNTQAGVPRGTATEGDAARNREAADSSRLKLGNSSSMGMDPSKAPGTGSQNNAADAAALKRREPNATGAQGAAAGAAIANRRAPQYSGAEGAAAGAAAANRRGSQYSGAEGAAAGAAVANRNQPQLSGAGGAVLGAAAANQNQPQMSGAQGAAIAAAATNASGPTAGSAAVVSSFANYGLYNQAWLTAHPEAWNPGNMVNAWGTSNWNAISNSIGANPQPQWYDYGDNVTYQNGNIVRDGQNLGTAEQFSQQAASLAETGAAAEPPVDTAWLPLGVFAMVWLTAKKVSHWPGLRLSIVS